jgi:hypothetical protein
LVVNPWRAFTTQETEMPIPDKDRLNLQQLAGEVATFAAQPEQQERIEGWRALNDLEMTKPMVRIYEIPWHEMNVDGELDLACEDEFCRGQEMLLRQSLYVQRHLAADNIIEGVVYSPLAIHDSGLGMRPGFSGPFSTAVTASGLDWEITSRYFDPQIVDESDVEKIQTPEVWHDERASDETYNRLCEIYDGILRVEKRGATGFWHALWDDLICWFGVTEGLSALVSNPDLVHKVLERYSQASDSRIKQYEELGLLSANACNTRVGSGGPAYTKELPATGSGLKRNEMWGNATSQIFSHVSPEHHDEFALRYEIPWMEEWALSYYGCCEPLHNKTHLLEEIPNLRKVSMSAWADVDQMAVWAQDRTVLSYKPSPAIVAGMSFDGEAVRRGLLDVLQKTRGCNISLVMKDISTVANKPRRLWEWARIASEVTEEFAASI